MYVSNIFSFYCVNVNFLLYGWVECLPLHWYSIIQILTGTLPLTPVKGGPRMTQEVCCVVVVLVVLVVLVLCDADSWALTGDWARVEGGGRREAAQIWCRLPLHTYDSHTPSTIHQALSISHTTPSYNTILPLTLYQYQSPTGWCFCSDKRFSEMTRA